MFDRGFVVTLEQPHVPPGNSTRGHEQFEIDLKIGYNQKSLLEKKRYRKTSI